MTLEQLVTWKPTWPIIRAVQRGWLLKCLRVSEYYSDYKLLIALTISLLILVTFFYLLVNSSTKMIKGEGANRLVETRLSTFIRLLLSVYWFLFTFYIGNNYTEKCDVFRWVHCKCCTPHTCYWFLFPFVSDHRIGW